MQEFKYQPTTETDTAKVARAFRISAIILGAAISIIVFYIYLAATMSAWQMYALSGVIGVFSIINVISLIVIRRGKPETGIWMLIIGMYIIFPSAALLVSNVGMIFGGTLILLTFLVANRNISQPSTLQALFISAVIGAITAGLDLIELQYRLFVPVIQTFIPLIVGVITLLVISLGFSITRKEINRNLRLKMTVWTGIIVAILSIALESYSILIFRQNLLNVAQSELIAIAEGRAFTVEETINQPFITARTTSILLKNIKGSNNQSNYSREQINELLRQIAIDNPDYLATYTLWEPNAFDGLDAQYKNTVGHDETGRFIPYWVRRADGSVTVEALMGYNTPGIGDWYLLPRQNKKEMVFAPLVYPVNGVDTVMASFIVPIMQGDTFYGITGVDAPIRFVQNIVDNINLYNGKANAILMTDSGTLIGVRNQPEMVSQPASSILPDFESLQTQIISGKTIISPSPDGKNLRVFAPVNIGNTGTHWIFGLIIPYSEITSQATSTAVRAAIISLLILAVTILVLWYLTGQVVRPIEHLTNTANSVSQGDFSKRASIETADEIGLLAQTFNAMSDTIQGLVGGLEERVAQRTTEMENATKQAEKRARELQSITEIAKFISTEQDLEKLLTSITINVSERFDFYHVGIFLLDENKRYAVLRAANSQGGKIMLDRGHKLEVGHVGIVGKVTETGEARIALDTGADAIYFNNPDLPDTRSEMALPLISRGEIIGALDVQSRLPNAFTEEDISIISLLADQLAVAIENARLLQETKKALSESQSIYREYVTNAWQKRTSGGITGYHINTAGGQVLTGPISDDVLQFDNQEQTISLPIRVREQVIGVINIQNKKDDRKLTKEEIGVIEAITERLGLALDNARLFEETSTRASRERAVADITTKIRSTTDPQEMIQTAIEELKQFLGARQIEVVPGKAQQKTDI
jgi:GAF domain-containing protein/HAMP domain-containing protein